MRGKTQTRRGTVAILVAISLVAIFGVVAIALDGGLLLNEHGQAQTAADAAALAAAIDLFSNYGTNNGLDPSGTASASARSTAASNGYANDGVTSVVTVNVPPESGNFAGKAGYAEVIIQYNQSRYFSKIFGSGSLPVTARAVARGVPGNIGLLILNPQVTVSAQICTTVNIQHGGQIYLNSNSSVLNSEFKGDGYVGGLFLDSTKQGGNPSLTCGGINVIASTEVSPYNINSGTVPGDVSFTNNGQLTQYTTPWPDPLANIPEPTTAGLTNYGDVTVTSTKTLQPGVYNSITIGSSGPGGPAPPASSPGSGPGSGSGSSTSGSSSSSSGPIVTLAPGLYYFTENSGAGLYLHSGSLQGTGVMFFLDWLKTDRFLNQANGPVTITPPNPTTGGTWPTGTGPSTYNGISLWLTRSSSQEIHVESTYSLTMNGTWYAAGWGGSGSSVGGEYDIRPDGASTVFNIGNYICNQAEWGQGYNASNNKSNGTINLNPGTSAPTQRPILVE